MEDCAVGGQVVVLDAPAPLVAVIAGDDVAAESHPVLKGVELLALVDGGVNGGAQGGIGDARVVASIPESSCQGNFLVWNEFAQEVYGDVLNWWVRGRSFLDLTLVVAGGTLSAVLGERIIQALGWWSYSSLMPLVPGLGVGAAPFVQLAALTVFTVELMRAFRPSRQAG